MFEEKVANWIFFFKHVIQNIRNFYSFKYIYINLYLFMKMILKMGKCSNEMVQFIKYEIEKV